MIYKEDITQDLSVDDIDEIVKMGLETLPIDGKRVLIIIPDGTRTMPMPTMFHLLEQYLTPRAASVDFLVALGTHQPMTDVQLSKLVDRTVIHGMTGNINIYNHQWDDPDTFIHIGTIPSEEVSQLSLGILSQDVPVKLNRLLLEADHIIICGPVFPHEVVGFSGGNKYLFPGVAGSEIINFTHWLGALITNYKINGTPDTPVRAIINRAAAFLDKPLSCFALVVTHSGTSGIYFGTPQEAWSAAVPMSQKKHIVYVDQPFKKVLSVMPDLYDDLWTGAKGMYKVEPAVENDGEIIIYAPAINEVSYTHGDWIDQIGYHTRDFFVKQWEHYQHVPWGVLAHSTHLKGSGSFDPLTGVEKPRIHVTLATGISEERCHKLNLNYLDPQKIDFDDWKNKEKEGIKMIPRAGELLFRRK